MRPLLGLGLVLLGLAQEKIDWRKDYETALGLAREQGRLVVVHFWMEGRPLCKTMNEETFAHPEVVRRSNEKFVSVRVDVEVRPELFQATIGGRGGLGTCVVDSTGDAVSALPGFAAAEAYLRFLEKAEKGYGALEAARERSSKDPDDLPALLTLAQVYEKLTSLKRAEECFQKVIGLAAGQSSITQETLKCAAHSQERIARFRVMRGKNREARQYLEEYRKLDPSNRFGRLDRAMLTEAFVLYVERRQQDALKIVEEGLQRFPSSEEADQMLLTDGMVRHELGDDVRALEILEGLLKKYPQSPWVSMARDQIGHIKNPPPEHQH